MEMKNTYLQPKQSRFPKSVPFTDFQKLHYEEKSQLIWMPRICRTKIQFLLASPGAWLSWLSALGPFMSQKQGLQNDKYETHFHVAGKK